MQILILCCSPVIPLNPQPWTPPPGLTAPGGEPRGTCPLDRSSQTPGQTLVTLSPSRRFHRLRHLTCVHSRLAVESVAFI